MTLTLVLQPQFSYFLMSDIFYIFFQADEDGTLKLLRDHITEQKVRWHHMSVSRDNKALVCSDCETEAATGACATCQVKLCDYCTGYHQRSARFKNHVVLSIEVVSNEELFDRQPIKCVTHGEEIKCFCHNCLASLCGECMLDKEHHGHVFKSLGEVMQSLQESLETSEDVTRKYREYLAKADDFQERSNQEREASRKLIEDTFAELIGMMEEEERKLLLWVDEAYDSSAAGVGGAKQMANHVETMRSYLRDVIKYPTSEVFDVQQTGATRLADAVARMQDASSKPSDDDATMVFLPREDNVEVSDDKCDLKLLARQVKCNDDELIEMRNQISDIKCIFMLKQCKFPELFPTMQLRFHTKNGRYNEEESVDYKDFKWTMSFSNDSSEPEVRIYCSPTNASLHRWFNTVRYQITIKNHFGDDRTVSGTAQFYTNSKRHRVPLFISWNDLATKGYTNKDNVIMITAQLREVRFRSHRISQG